MPVKILHTSDLHIGAKLLFLADKADVQREQIKQTFAKMADQAIAGNVDLFLLAGDIFDYPFPSELNIAFVKEQLQKLVNKGIYVAIIPGNHDLLLPGSVWTKPEWDKLSRANLKVFKNPAEKWLIPDLNLMLQATAISQQKSKESPVAGFGKDTKAKYNVGLIHGSLTGVAADTNYPIAKKDLETLGFDYFALGDWHSTLDLAVKNTRAFYSGAPEACALDQTNSGNYLLIDLPQSGAAKVIPVSIGAVKIKKINLDLEKITDIGKLIYEIGQYKNRQMILLLNFTGFRSLDLQLDTDELLKHFAADFFFIKFTDQSSLKISAAELEKFPAEFITGKFIASLQSRKSKDAGLNRIIDKAIQLGVKLLTPQSS